MEHDYKTECLKAQQELAMLYDISNAMRTTLNLEEILYIILTAVTSHAGLSFNRAMLFLVNEKEDHLEGKMGIGPDSREDADSIWSHIEKHKMGLTELINTHQQFEHLKKSKLHKTVTSIKIPIANGEKNRIVETVKHAKTEFEKTLHLEDFITVPLKARDKVIGVILADNLFTKKTITHDDIRVLTMFANQAGLAIENSYLYEKTVILSNQDSLTGLWHHGYFQYLLGEEIKRSHKKKISFSLLMIDIDNFKNFNDTYGHPAGDSILKNISNIFRDVARKIDVIARYGGEEFAIILPATKKEDSLMLAERLRKSVEENPLMKGITISIGVASFPEDGEENHLLIEKSDKALYEAKKTGKNKVCT